MKYVLLVVYLMLIIHQNANGQLFIGISGDLGNRMSTATDPEFFKKRPAFSGHIFLKSVEDLNEHWQVSYGAGLGVMGTIIRARIPDTLTNYYNDMYDIFAFYETLYVSFDLNASRKIATLGMRPLHAVAGGGFTYYATAGYTRYGVGVVVDNKSYEVFETTADLRPNNFLPFANVALELGLNERFIAGIRYRYHFSPIIQGSYEFYHVDGATFGTFTVAQRFASLYIQCRLGKRMRKR